MKRGGRQARCKLRWTDAVQLSKEKKAGFEVSNLNCLSSRQPLTRLESHFALRLFGFPFFPCAH